MLMPPLFSVYFNRRLYAALNNCGFVSTADMANEPSAPFAFLMDASMLGVGVGFDTRVRRLERLLACLF